MGCQEDLSKEGSSHVENVKTWFNKGVSIF